MERRLLLRRHPVLNTCPPPRLAGLCAAGHCLPSHQQHSVCPERSGAAEQAPAGGQLGSRDGGTWPQPAATAAARRPVARSPLAPPHRQRQQGCPCHQHACAVARPRSSSSSWTSTGWLGRPAGWPALATGTAGCPAGSCSAGRLCRTVGTGLDGGGLAAAAATLAVCQFTAGTVVAGDAAGLQLGGGTIQRAVQGSSTRAAQLWRQDSGPCHASFRLLQRPTRRHRHPA